MSQGRQGGCTVLEVRVLELWGGEGFLGGRMLRLEGLSCPGRGDRTHRGQRSRPGELRVPRPEAGSRVRA